METIQMDSVLDQMYADFTTKFLPKVSEGLVITKDYFLDLFGRYIDFLIIENFVFLVGSVVCVILSIIIFRKLLKFIKDKESYFRHFEYESDKDKSLTGEGLVTLILWISVAFSLWLWGIFSTIRNSIDVAKLYFIPEIYIMERLDILKPGTLPK